MNELEIRAKKWVSLKRGLSESVSFSVSFTVDSQGSCAKYRVLIVTKIRKSENNCQVTIKTKVVLSTCTPRASIVTILS